MEQTFSSRGESRTLTAFFDSRDDAQRALDRLDGLGLASGSAKLVRGNDATASNGDNESRGFWESLSDFFFPDDDRATYAEGLRRGGFLVTAKDIPADKYAEALDILDDEGSVDVDARSSEWRSEGWNGTSYGDGAPFQRTDAASATDFSMGGTGVGASAFSGAKLEGGSGGYDENKSLGSDRPATDTFGDLRARNEAEGETGLGGVAGPSMSDTSGSDLDRDAFNRDRQSSQDEAITSASAPIASDAARLDDPYAAASRAFARRDTDTGRTRARSYTYNSLTESDADRSLTEVEIEDERSVGVGQQDLANRR